KKHPDYLLSLLIRLSWEPEVPIRLNKESTRSDSIAAFRYYKNHFWSDIDLSDARVVRTPVFHNKLKKYLTEVILQHPDTFVYEAEYLIARTKNDSDMFKYIVWFSVYAAESSKIVGMDKAFVYLAKSYYLAGRCWWASNVVLKTMRERVEKLERILIGMVAPELRMWDTTKNIVSMHAVEATYLILAFWEYDCGHCKKTLPVLRDYYHMYKDKGVKVFSVCTKKDMKRWKKYINENNLDFINVNGAYHLQFGSQTDNNPYFYDLPYNEVYDIVATPVFFLLDKDKKIIAKRIEPQQMFEIIDRELMQQKKEPQ
ncbi:MAG: redoxin domain-containing protein, partial [Bacteroidales bacterium]|nr:redoxin domain-containing protein [Bacteroidales bacterium]